MVVMAIGDVLVMNFFWMVKDEGSWLDIGTTISHFVIGSLLSVFVAGLEGVSEALIGGVDVEEGGREVVGGEGVKGNGRLERVDTRMGVSGKDERPEID